MASAVSRKGASVVQLEPMTARRPLLTRAAPPLVHMCMGCAPEPASKLAVGVENAQAGHIHDRQAFLAPCLAQQCTCREDRRGRRVLVVENGRHCAATKMIAETQSLGHTA